MEKFINLLKAADRFYSGDAASNDAIEQAETTLSLKFSPEYREYLMTYGVASIYGHEFTGLGLDGPLNVVEATEYQRKKNPEIDPTYYVVEETHIDDIVIWQSFDGTVYQSFSDCAVKKINGSLSEYIENEKTDSSKEEPVVKEKKSFKLFRKKKRK